MKELVNLGSQFIRVCDETATLRGKALTLFALYTFLSCFYMLSYFSLPEAMRRAEERANDLETKLKASEEARKKAEKDDANVKYLRQRLQAVENALSDKDAKQFERENNIVTRFETQSRRFSSNTFFPFFFCFSLFLNIFGVDYLLLFFSRKNGQALYFEPRIRWPSSGRSRNS
jgi:hypothetical protein